VPFEPMPALVDPRQQRGTLVRLASTQLAT
jgi:hypothetical protein